MYNEEVASDVVGKHCTLTESYRGYTEGEVIGDYGCQLLVQISSGAEILVYRDEIILK